MNLSFVEKGSTQRIRDEDTFNAAWAISIEREIDARVMTRRSYPLILTPMIGDTTHTRQHRKMQRHFPMRQDLMRHLNRIQKHSEKLGETRRALVALTHTQQRTGSSRILEDPGRLPLRNCSFPPLPPGHVACQVRPGMLRCLCQQRFPVPAPWQYPR